MRKITAITALIQDLSDLLDKGKSFSIEEVNSQIENKKVIDWLEREFPFGSDNGLDFSHFTKSDRDYVHNELYSYWVGYAGDERRKWGIENNGLCILLSWSVEVVKDLYGREGENPTEEKWIEA